MNQPDLHRSRGTDPASGRNAYGVTAETNGSQGGTMMQNIRRRVAARLAGEESGFTLIELLVVMLILGILAAIALPAFFNQKDKASDSKAKEYAHSAQVAMETCATDNDNSYANCDVAALDKIESTLPAAPAGEGKEGLTVVKNTADEYEIKVTASTGDTFSIARDSSGKSTFPCTGEGGCPPSLKWN